jgi:hypothetical protein
VDESAEFVAGNCNPACSVVPPQLALAAYNVTVLFLESNGDPLRDFEIRSDLEGATPERSVSAPSDTMTRRLGSEALSEPSDLAVTPPNLSSTLRDIAIDVRPFQ